MKRYTVGVFVWVLALFFQCASESPCAAGDFTQDQMKKMGVFLSNFTELGFYTVDSRDFADPLHPEKAIRFGIWHNYRNNYSNDSNSRIKQCSASCPYGSLTIDGKYVAESIQKYLGFAFDRHQSVASDFIKCHYDGKAYHFEGADGEITPHARVLDARTISEGVIRLRGELFNPEEPSETMGTFTAEITPTTWKGKPSWNLLNLNCKRD